MGPMRSVADGTTRLRVGDEGRTINPNGSPKESLSLEHMGTISIHGSIRGCKPNRMCCPSKNIRIAIWA